MGSEALPRVEDHGKQGFTASRGSWEARLYHKQRIMGSEVLLQVEDNEKRGFTVSRGSWDSSFFKSYTPEGLYGILNLN